LFSNLEEGTIKEFENMDYFPELAAQKEDERMALLALAPSKAQQLCNLTLHAPLWSSAPLAEDWAEFSPGMGFEPTQEDDECTELGVPLRI
jgi:hypothetical protein